MLNLRLRDEFLGEQMPQTAIRLVSNDKRGAVQQAPKTILDITYPTTDIQNALRSICANRQSRPIVLMGERGLGKSHIMAVMHHAVSSPDIVETWAHDWRNRVRSDILTEIKLQQGFCAISEPVHNNEYMLLWDLIFDRHPNGQRFRGRFEASGQPIPSRSLMEELFTSKPTALILDEFQTWFDGLHDETGAEGRRWRQNAFAFIQILSELAKDRPDILILVVSVLNNSTEAFQQIHRDTPVVIDFKGPTAKLERKKLLLHRLFQNRDTISQEAVKSCIATYASERFRLRFSHQSESERDDQFAEVEQSWPFSPELIDLLEGHILMAQAAQQTRDLIRILAQVYRARGEAIPILTPADFLVDDDSCGVQTLLDSIATMASQDRLREVAQRNLQNIISLGAETPHSRELLSALWMRSMSPGRSRGGTRHELHLDITRDERVDDNAFNAELEKVVSNSVNIHGEESPDGHLHFDLEENPRAKVRSIARNDRLWHQAADPNSAGQICYPGKDIEHIRLTLRALYMPEARQLITKAIILGPEWRSNPWGEIEEDYRPSHWTEPVLIVIPEPLPYDKIASELGPWLGKHLQTRRNTVRFLLMKPDVNGLYTDQTLLFNARCSYLVSKAWKDDPVYRQLKTQFDRAVRDELKSRFDRFAVLDVWNFQSLENTRFHIERIDKEGSDIPPRVEEMILKDIFDPAEFEQFICVRAKQSYVMNDILSELMDPSSEQAVLPFLGYIQIEEKIFEIAAKGLIALNIDGTWVGRLPEHQTERDAYNALKRFFKSGPELKRIQLSHPSVIGTPPVRGAQPPIQQPPTPSAKTPPVDNALPADLPKPGPVPIDVPVSPVNRVSEPTIRKHRTEEPAIPINLTGSFEKWGVASDATLSSAKIEFSNLTVNQVKQILMRIPSSVKASLEIGIAGEQNP